MTRKCGLVLLSSLIMSLAALSPVLAAGQLQTENGQPLDVLAGKVKTWKELHALHRKYPMDDGAVAEEYSDFVVETLAKRWSTLPELMAIAKRDPAFEKFVLSHIDETADEDDLKAVVRNASRHCPAGDRKLCEKIAATARAALRRM